MCRAQLAVPCVRGGTFAQPAARAGIVKAILDRRRPKRLRSYAGGGIEGEPADDVRVGAGTPRRAIRQTKRGKPLASTTKSIEPEELLPLPLAGDGVII
jgi:hypothetical protein